LRRQVLGVDLASARWADNGTCLLSFDGQRFYNVTCDAIAWPPASLSAEALADAIDQRARSSRVVAVSLDGPQGWRDPRTAPSLPGVGRRCEFLCKTQGKVGVYPNTYPSTQRRWIEFSIEVFGHLLSKPGVMMAGGSAQPTPPKGYLLLECYPTSAWRASGLKPLPGKAAKPALAGFQTALCQAYGLPLFTAPTHDHLQAVVAAITAAGAAGGPARPLPRGVPTAMVGGLRVEGLIWDVAPLNALASASAAQPSLAPSNSGPHASEGPALRVTSGVLAQVNKAGPGHAQISLRGFPGGTRREPLVVRFVIRGERHALVVKDSHASWRAHQTQETMTAFEGLFALLAEEPGTFLPVTEFESRPLGA
jgi:hypothetical protein